jgi:hypothetical protein
MATGNTLFLAPRVDTVGADFTVTEYDILIAEMISIRDDMVKFAQSTQQTADPYAAAVTLELAAKISDLLDTLG